ncbi:MAG: V-type ATP synthase subunit E family protein [Oscillospiraceae bacterium]|nr:V-type ATP synthase subunit E family protein [Oscillospiraceae bacterium]
MNGIDKITQRLIGDAEQEVAAIRAEAEGACAEVAKAYEQQAQDTFWQLVTAGKQAADLRGLCMFDAAALESKKRILTLKQEMVAQAFVEAEAQILNLPEEEYILLLAKLAAKAARTGEEQLIFSPKDRGLYGKRVTMVANEMLKRAGTSAAFTMGEESRDITGGVIVTDGRIDTNCSLEALIAACRRELTPVVAQILFD